MPISFRTISILSFLIIAFATAQPHSPAWQHLTTPGSISKPSSFPIVLPQTNVSVDPAGQITCDARSYGQKLKVTSCYKIFTSIAKDDKQINFADRGSLVRFDLPLPYRLQSSDGLCYIQMVLDANAESGHVTSTQFGEAALVVYRECVVKYGYGGIASNIGGDNHLSVVISSYKPQFTCSQNTAPPWRAVVHIFAGMLASKRKQSFGRKGKPNLDVELPFEYKAFEGSARLLIDSTDDRKAVSSWYEIWEAVNTIAYTCVKSRDKGGKVTQIGSLKNIYVILFDDSRGVGETVGGAGQDPFEDMYAGPQSNGSNGSVVTGLPLQDAANTAVS
ncbi:hypothetical protein ACLMJK_004573 [Lecanora helva]